MDMLGPLPKTLNGIQVEVVVTDRYSKVVRAISTSKVTAWHIASLFMDSWIVPCGIRKHLLDDNRTQLLSKVLGIYTAC